MPGLFPPAATMASAFPSPLPLPAAAAAQRVLPPPATEYWVASASDKAPGLSTEAQRKLRDASARTRQMTGKIEMHSAKYYAACTLGGLLACVSTATPTTRCTKAKDELETGHNAHGRHAAGPGQMPAAGRSGTIQGQLPGVVANLARRRSARRLYGVEPYSVWLFCPRGIQIRRVRFPSPPTRV